MKHSLSILLLFALSMLAVVDRVFAADFKVLPRHNFAAGVETYASVAPFGLFALALLIILVAVIGIWSAFSSRKPHFFTRLLGIASSANDLFLSLNFKTENETFQGYLRSIDMKGAMFVSPRKIKKGGTTLLDLGSLPGFPTEAAFIDASVTSIRSLGGEPTNYMISVKFSNRQDESNIPLEQYLHSLTARIQ